jgi:integrase
MATNQMTRSGLGSESGSGSESESFVYLNPKSMQKFDSVIEWLEFCKTEKTRLLYGLGLQKFCNFHRITPDSIRGMQPDGLKRLIIEYVVFMKKNAKNHAGKPRPGEISINSIPHYMAGIQSFAEHLEIPLPWKKIRKSFPDQVANDFRSYTREEIAKLLEIAGLRERVIILVSISSGLRVGALPDLKVKHVIRIPEAPELAFLRIYGNSKKDRYLSLLTPEALVAIDRYVKYREDQGEKITQDSPLVRDKFGFESKRRTNKPMPIKAQSIQVIMRELVIKANLPLTELQPDHSLRKFFNTMAKNAGLDHMFKEMFMGHSIKLDDVYYDIDNPESRQKIISEYAKAVDLLTIDPRQKMKSELLRVKREMQKKDELIGKYEIMRQELQNAVSMAVEQAKKTRELEARLAEIKR